MLFMALAENIFKKLPRVGFYFADAHITKFY